MRGLFKISGWFFPLARRVLYFWVRTTVFAEAAAAIDPARPVCYVLHDRHLSNLLVLFEESLRAGLPPAEAPLSFGEKLRQSAQLIPCALLIVFICWVLIAGYATATECAAYGVVGSLTLAAWSRSLTWDNFREGLMSTARTSCMIMFILAGAAFLTKTMAFTGIPRELAEWVSAMNLSPIALIGVLTVIYLILGTALDGISMIVLTSAVVLPMIQKAGFDLIWFGIFIIMLVEIAEVTPPVGFNLFVLQNMTGLDSNRIAMVTLPFFYCMLVGIALITVFPSIVTSVPNWLMGVPK